jgi:large subunit ribosomal protein L21
MHAVIRTGGKQYRVAADDVIKVEKLAGEAGDQIVFDEVLAVGAEVGAPLVDGAAVAARVIAQDRGDKIIIFKKKRRKNYRRRKGHRQDLTVLRIEEILTGGKKPTGKAAAKKTAPKEDKKGDDKAEAKGKSEAKDDAPKKEAAKKEAAKKDDAPAKTGGPRFAAPKGEKDDLKKISGVGPKLEEKLNELGIATYAQIAAFTKDDIEFVDAELKFKGRIERDDWIKQAKELAKG